MHILMPVAPDLPLWAYYYFAIQYKEGKIGKKSYWIISVYSKSNFLYKELKRKLIMILAILIIFFS